MIFESGKKFNLFSKKINTESKKNINLQRFNASERIIFGNQLILRGPFPNGPFKVP